MHCMNVLLSSIVFDFSGKNTGKILKINNTTDVDIILIMH